MEEEGEKQELCVDTPGCLVSKRPVFTALRRGKETWEMGRICVNFYQTSDNLGQSSDNLCQSGFFCRVDLHLVNLGFFN
jgi:hypothetical protein